MALLFHRQARPVCPRIGSVVSPALLLGCLSLLLLIPSGSAEAKRKAPYRPQPDLRILSITPSHISHSFQNGPLDIVIEIELPIDLDDTTILEVASLISSPSKRSMRFLSNRQPVGAAALSQSNQAPSSESKPKPQLAVTLTWDGIDQNQKIVEQGTYSYEVRAKLLAGGEKGPRTQMISWPKRGTLDVK
ncbi:MAG: hypothetical protein FJ245_09045 [Nitrospira sp.]|nr:hypothetical protein [Nitrospira sp.]